MPVFEFLATVRVIVDARTVSKAKEAAESDLSDVVFAIESIEEV